MKVASYVCRIAVIIEFRIFIKYIIYINVEELHTMICVEWGWEIEENDVWAEFGLNKIGIMDLIEYIKIYIQSMYTYK